MRARAGDRREDRARLRPSLGDGAGERAAPPSRGAALFFVRRGRYPHRMVRCIYSGRVVTLNVERVTLPNGASVDLELVRHPGAAAVAAVDGDGRVVLISQYRHAAGGYVWELPAGVLDHPGEPPIDCAARELREETGLGAGRLTPLGQVMPTCGYSDERIHLFLAEELRDGAHAQEHDEVIREIRRVPLRDALAMVRAGDVVDAKTVAGLYLAAARLGAAA